METPEVVVERERERVNSSPSFPRRHKILFGVVIFIGILLYAGFNLWVYRSAKSGKEPSLDASPRQAVSNSSPTLTLTPSPRPTGPGEFACDPYGVCNKYGENARKQYCRVTYADDRCLDQCGDKEKQCSK